MSIPSEPINDVPATSVGWGIERFTYDLEQVLWIARMLGQNGNEIWKVMDNMDTRSCGFPGWEKLHTFKDGALWVYMVNKVKRCCEGHNEFDDTWNVAIRTIHGGGK